MTIDFYSRDVNGLSIVNEQIGIYLSTQALLGILGITAAVVILRRIKKARGL